jgi:hypothetical protein
MSNPMHIGTESWLTGRVRTLCGRTLGPGDGADYNAPLCPVCRRKAGWTHDERR